MISSGEGKVKRKAIESNCSLNIYNAFFLIRFGIQAVFEIKMLNIGIQT